MAQRALSVFRIGAGAWVVTGVGHLALTVAVALQPRQPTAARAVAAMRAHTTEIAGLRRSLYELDRGMSLVMAVALVFGGLVCLLVARSAPDLVTRSRSVSGLGLACSLVALGLSLWSLPVPPIVLFAVASAAFGTALVKAGPEVSAQLA
ncbi:hypothetical protein LZG04_25710 [Saccharothrix sp. S26]|uniref:LIC_13387 family protein n=1 Tax=Saccharothrix sp. S26 TaxID=2907215 RepID=UPI001F1AA18C|nr:hypothetical protein [Saccharothrix sp. S26]MCE6998168.1 hypothetical protein [Saccharothrix sp. S26]